MENSDRSGASELGNAANKLWETAEASTIALLRRNTYINMALLVVNEEGGGVPLGVLPNLDSAILRVHVVVWYCQNPCNGLIELDQNRESIFALTVKFHNRREAPGGWLGQGKAVPRRQ